MLLATGICESVRKMKAVMLLVGLIEIETRISLNLAMKLSLYSLPLLSRIKQI
jgi:hypothetical protein